MSVPMRWMNSGSSRTEDMRVPPPHPPRSTHPSSSCMSDTAPRGAASWDLLGLVVLGGLVGTLYRLAQRAVTREWLIVAVGTGAVALVVAAIVMFATRA